MKIRSFGFLILILVVVTFSCKKESYGPLSPLTSGLKYIVQGNNVHITWESTGEKLDNYTIELSKIPDLSIADDTRTINETSHTYRGLNPGDIYHVRVRSNRTSPPSNSAWSTLQFTVLPGNILLPVTDQDINGKTVTLKWAFDSTASDQVSKTVTKVVLTPIFGQPRDISLSAQEIQSKTLVVENLSIDMQYTVRIYNGNFPNGIQVFTTLAEPVNSVWTLSPHSDLKSAIEDSKNGDVIVLKPGIYNAWQKQITINSKSIEIRPLAGSVNKPKLYIKGFDLSGTGSGLSLIGLDVSGARLDEYKEEIANSGDTRWNNWLVTLVSTSLDFDHLQIRDCIVRNYWTGMLKMNGDAQKANSVTIDNSIVHHIGGDNTIETIAVGKAGLKQAIFTNSTFYMSGKQFIAIDREKIPPTEFSFIFRNNTVDQGWSAAGFSFKELKAPGKVLLQNNIFSNITCAGSFFNNFSFVANNFDKRLINCNFYNVLSKQTICGSNSSNMPVHSWELRHPNIIWTEVKPAFIMNDAQHANPNSIKEYAVSINPGYKNAANIDFTVAPGSPLRAIDNGNAIGDPRWW